jgi:hypothetical protein
MVDDEREILPKSKNPLYHPGVEGTSTGHLLRAKARATGLERQRIDFELATRTAAELRKGQVEASRPQSDDGGA